MKCLGGRGDNFEKSHTYMDLGVNESRDVVNAIKWLRQQCYVDQSEIHLWGWSYGGYLSSMVAAEVGVAFSQCCVALSVLLFLTSHPESL